MTVTAVWWALGGAVAGLIAGSFIATLVIRWPQGRSLNGRSACDGCGRVLTIGNLFPIVSWVLARGRCRTCGAKIDWHHPVIEGTAGLIGVTAMIAQPGVEGIAGAVFGWQLLTLAVLDVEHFWLPDRLTLTLAVSGLLFSLAGVGIAFQSRLIGGVIGFAALSSIAWGYRKIRGRDGMGGGDPKLLGGIGCWMGWQSLPFLLIGASALGLFVALVMVMRGDNVAAHTRLPLGSLMAAAACALWVLFSQI